MSQESQKLSTKKRIAMHIIYALKFKMALYASALLMTVVENCFKPNLLLWSWSLVFLIGLLSCRLLTFITVVLLLLSN